MAADGLIEAWNLPLGCVAQLFREIAGRRPGLLTRVGIGTFVDPRQGGGRLNAIATKTGPGDGDRGREWLFYEAIPVDVAIIRGTTADPDGNISMEREALILDNSGDRHGGGKASKGFVVAQVERLAAADALPASRWWCRASWSIAWWWPRPSCTSRPRHQLTPPSPASSRCRSTASRLWPWTSARSSPGAVPWSCRWAAWSISASACRRPWPRWPRRRTCSTR